MTTALHATQQQPQKLKKGRDIVRKEFECFVRVNGKIEKKLVGHGLVVVSFNENADSIDVEGGFAGLVESRVLVETLIDLAEKFPNGRRNLLYALGERIFGEEHNMKRVSESITNEIDEFLADLLRKGSK